MSTHKIIWERWLNPFLPITDDHRRDEDDDDECCESADAFVNYPPQGQAFLGPSYRGIVFQGPLGVVPIDENNDPAKLFKLFVAHTNFDVTSKIMASVEQIEGVEVLKALSRYRFWLGIGKAFQTADVKSAVEKALCGTRVDGRPTLIKLATHLRETSSGEACNQRHLER